MIEVNSIEKHSSFGFVVKYNDGEGELHVLTSGGQSGAYDVVLVDMQCDGEVKVIAHLKEIGAVTPQQRKNKRLSFHKRWEAQRYTAALAVREAVWKWIKDSVAQDFDSKSQITTQVVDFWIEEQKTIDGVEEPVTK